MTTNLPGALDEAFKSRIHYQIHFPLLTRQQTLEIWKINLHRLRCMEQELANKTSHRSMEIYDEEILRFAEAQFNNNTNNFRRTCHWNGRQIRNAFQVARSLAYADAENETQRLRSSNPFADIIVPVPRLEVRHFQLVGEITTSFDQYMLQVYSGMTDADLAKEKEHRADDFIFRGTQHGDRQTQLETQQHQQIFDFRLGGSFAPTFDANTTTSSKLPQARSSTPREQYSVARGYGPSLDAISRGANSFGSRRSPSPRKREVSDKVQRHTSFYLLTLFLASLWFPMN